MLSRCSILQTSFTPLLLALALLACLASASLSTPPAPPVPPDAPAAEEVIPQIAPAPARGSDPLIAGSVLWNTSQPQLDSTDPLDAAPLLRKGDLSHAWIITPSDSGKHALIWHVPPRGGELSGGWKPGTARLAGDLTSIPTQIVAVENRLYLIYDNDPFIPNLKPRDVLIMSAVPVEGGDQWVTRPLNRFEVAPSLRTDGTILSAVGSDGTVWVLMHALLQDGNNDRRLALLRLAPDGWESIPLPSQAQALAEAATVTVNKRLYMPLKWKLVATSQGVSLALIPEAAQPGALQEQLIFWRCKAAFHGGPASTDTQRASDRPPSSPIVLSKDLPNAGAEKDPRPSSKTQPKSTSPPAPKSSPVPIWTKWSPQWPDLKTIFPTQTPSPYSNLQLIGLRDQVVAIFGTSTSTCILTCDINRMGLNQANPQSLIFTHRTPLLPLDASAVAAAALDTSSGLLLINSIIQPELVPRSSISSSSGRIRIPATRFTEISTRTGRLLFEGELAPQSPVRASDFRLIGAILLLILGTIIVFIVRPPREDGSEIHLPDGTSLADTPRRLIAAIIDLAVAVIIGSALWGSPLVSFLDPIWWGTQQSLQTLGTILAFLVAFGTVSEFLFERTFGKLFMGIAVVSLGDRQKAKARPAITDPNNPTPSTPTSKPLPQRQNEDDQDDRVDPTFSELLIRNSIKWLALPAAILGLIDVSKRHRGDQWANTVVVEYLPEEDDEE